MSEQASFNRRINGGDASHSLILTARGFYRKLGSIKA